jgi:hypothetical protein
MSSSTTQDGNSKGGVKEDVSETTNVSENVEGGGESKGEGSEDKGENRPNQSFMTKSEMDAYIGNRLKDENWLARRKKSKNSPT